MPDASATALTRHYKSLQKAWSVADRSVDYGKLVVPSGNNVEPIHQWFHLKEAFSHQLLERLIKDAGFDSVDQISIFDPFAGSGTSLLSALTFGYDYGCEVRGLGIERNPFLHLLAKTKVAAYMRGSAVASVLTKEFELIRNLYRRIRRNSVDLPPSATLANHEYFPNDHAVSLVRIGMAIDSVSRGLTRGIFRVCLGASVEASSLLRRDGRALRFESKRVAREPWEAFCEKVSTAVEDLKKITPSDADVRVLRGDGRRASSVVRKDEKFDLIVFSPPYPNNIDYTEVYKVESWVLGHYKNADDMRKQRISTVRSHPSIRFKDSYSYERDHAGKSVSSIVDPILESVPDDKRYRIGRKQVVKGYADDMYRVLKGCRRLASNDARLVFIVGNSVHGTADESFVIAADVIMGAVAELVGWRVEEVRVARHLTRRRTDSPFLRESVVSLRPV